MSDLLFESEWHRIPVNLQKYVILMIADMQRPVFYHGFRIAVLDLETFAKVEQLETFTFFINDWIASTPLFFRYFEMSSHIIWWSRPLHPNNVLDKVTETMMSPIQYHSALGLDEVTSHLQTKSWKPTIDFTEPKIFTHSVNQFKKISREITVYPKISFHYSFTPINVLTRWYKSANIKIVYLYQTCIPKELDELKA